MTAEEKLILEDYKKAFRSYYSDKKIINLDERFHKKLDCFLVRLEDSLSNFEYTVPPYRVSNFLIIYITKGEGERIIGKVKVPIRDRTLLIVPSQTAMSGIHSTDTAGYYLSFNLKFFLQEHFPRHHLLNMYLFQLELVPYIHVNFIQHKNLVNIFETILDERDHERLNKNEMIALKTLELIIFCERLFKREERLDKKTLPPLVIQYLDLIQKHYSEHHAVTYYAERLHIHPNVLNAICKKHLLQSAKATIDLKLVTEAQSLLDHTALTVKEIAYDLGFQSASHFFRFFRRLTGNSPVRYRSSHLNL